MSKELFEKYGISEEVTAENIGEVQEKLEKAVIDKHLNDPNFYSTLDATKLPDTLFKTKYEEAKKSEVNETIKLIDKQYGLTKEEKATFTPEELTDRSKYLAKSYSLLMARDNSKESIQKIQLDFATREEEYTSKIAELTELSEKKGKDADARVEAFRIDMAVMSINQSLEKNLVIKTHTAVGIALPRLKEKYAVVLEADRPVLRQKDNPNLKVLVQGTSKELTIEQALIEEYKSEDIWKEAEEGGQQGAKKGTTTYEPGKGADFTPEELKQIEQEKALYGEK